MRDVTIQKIIKKSEKYRSFLFCNAFNVMLGSIISGQIYHFLHCFNLNHLKSKEVTFMIKKFVVSILLLTLKI